MRLRFLLVPACFLLSAVAHADPFTTTITGNGLTLIFPNQGGPIYGNYSPRGAELQAVPLALTVNGTPTVGELDFFLSSSPSYRDLGVSFASASNLPSDGFDLFGPDLVVNTGGINFYSAPGTYNLTDSIGTPYTYVVTDDSLSPVPEPSTLALTTIPFIFFLVLTYRRILSSPKDLNPFKTSSLPLA